MATRAADIAARIRQNVTAYMADRISYETFHEQQRVLWDEAEAAGPRTKSAVCDQLRANP